MIPSAAGDVYSFALSHTRS